MTARLLVLSALCAVADGEAIRQDCGAVAVSTDAVALILRGEAFRGLPGVEAQIADPVVRTHVDGRLLRQALGCTGASLALQLAVAKTHVKNVVEPLERRGVRVDVFLAGSGCRGAPGVANGTARTYWDALADAYGARRVKYARDASGPFGPRETAREGAEAALAEARRAGRGYRSAVALRLDAAVFAPVAAPEDPSADAAPVDFLSFDVEEAARAGGDAALAVPWRHACALRDVAALLETHHPRTCWRRGGPCEAALERAGVPVRRSFACDPAGPSAGAFSERGSPLLAAWLRGAPKRRAPRACPAPARVAAANETCAALRAYDGAVECAPRPALREVCARFRATAALTVALADRGVRSALRCQPDAIARGHLRSFAARQKVDLSVGAQQARETALIRCDPNGAARILVLQEARDLDRDLWAMYRPVRETLARGLGARAAACGYTVRALSGYRAAKKELRRGDTAIFIGVLWPGEETGVT